MITKKSRTGWYQRAKSIPEWIVRTLTVATVVASVTLVYANIEKRLTIVENCAVENKYLLDSYNLEVIVYKLDQLKIQQDECIRKIEKLNSLIDSVEY